MKSIFRILLLSTILLIPIFVFKTRVSATTYCNGGVSYINYYARCSYDPTTDTSTCTKWSENKYEACTFGVFSCGGVAYQQTTQNCWINPNGSCSFTSFIDDRVNNSVCSTCNDQIWGACSTSCGPGTQTNQCGGTRPCNNGPCESCSPGQQIGDNTCGAGSCNDFTEKRTSYKTSLPGRLWDC